MKSEGKRLSEKQIKNYLRYLEQEEKSPVTREKYLRDARAFVRFADNTAITKDTVTAWKRHLLERGYAIRSINSMLSAVNGLLEFTGLHHCKVKAIRMQRQAFCAEEKELTKADYLRLLEASRNDPRLNLVIQTICCTGIRVSELRYFTVAAVRHGEVTVNCKSKTRTIFVPGKLKKMLLRYAKQQNCVAGAIFVDRNGKPLDRSVIWREMKHLCGSAGVKASKVFPHNLRKLFARTFYTMEKDIAKLADLLGHSSINTTRIYIMTTGAEHRRKIERLGLVMQT